MATYYARANGNVNATNVWSTTPSGATSDLFPSFTSADTLMSNGFTITLNVNTTVLEIKNDTTGGATAGGTFNLNNSITLSANLYAGNSIICTYAGASPNSATIIGNINGGTVYTGVLNNSTGTLNVVGTITGGIGAGAIGVSNGAGIINITGNVIAGASVNGAHAVVNGTGTINITGNVNGSNGSNTSGVVNQFAGIINIIGSVIGGGGNTNSTGVTNSGIGTVNIIGTCVAGSVGSGAWNSGSGTLTATRAKGNAFGNGSVGLSSVTGVFSSQNGTTRVYEIEYGDLGQSPTGGPISFVNDTSNKALFYRPSLTKKTLVDSAASLDLPAASNVRSGTTYNFGSNTGTCAIPPASSVAFGVAVDNTTGTATLTPQSIWDMLTSNISASNSIGERLKNSATIDSVASQVITIKGA